MAPVAGMADQSRRHLVHQARGGVKAGGQESSPWRVHAPWNRVKPLSMNILCVPSNSSEDDSQHVRGGSCVAHPACFSWHLCEVMLSSSHLQMRNLRL